VRGDVEAWRIGGAGGSDCDTGRAGRAADSANRLAASDVSNAVLPARARPVMPMRMVLRICKTSVANRDARWTASIMRARRRVGCLLSLSSGCQATPDHRTSRLPDWAGATVGA
jgi:hypothetical protein